MKNYNCLLLPNTVKDEGLALTRRIAAFLIDRGCTIWVTEPAHTQLAADLPVRLLEEKDTGKISLIIPLGGDGTIIGAIRRYKQLSVPFLGINLGAIGFLAEVEPEKAEAALADVLEDRVQIEERILLEGCIEKADGSEAHSFTAINEVLINRHMMASLIEMDVSINDQHIESYLGDGLIVCTPTGSTAYNLSAGGPIIAPSARNLVITPLCVHSLNVRSIVTSENDSVRIRIGEGKNRHGYPSIISIDGQKSEWLANGDVVRLRRSDRTVSLIRIGDHTFYQTLKKKLF